jgi:hypothetical protein
MPDWLIKLWGSITSKKTAFIALLTCLLFVFFSKTGIDFVTQKGVSDAYSTFVVILIFYSASHLLTELFATVWSYVIKAGVQIRLLYRKNKQNQSIRINLESAIPQLPMEQLEILIELSEGEEKFNLKQSRVFYLHNQNFIKKLHQISSSEFVFKIDPVVKSVLVAHLEIQRKVYLEDFILNIPENQLQFLSIFFSEELPFGTEESGTFMESNVHSSVYELCKNNIIKKLDMGKRNKSKIKYQLVADVGQILSERIINKPISRITVELDNNFIYAPYSSGGNAMVS